MDSYLTLKRLEDAEWEESQTELQSGPLHAGAAAYPAQHAEPYPPPRAPPPHGPPPLQQHVQAHEHGAGHERGAGGHQHQQQGQQAAHGGGGGGHHPAHGHGHREAVGQH